MAMEKTGRDGGEGFGMGSLTFLGVWQLHGNVLEIESRLPIWMVSSRT